jgi:hypothetical protein
VANADVILTHCLSFVELRDFPERIDLYDVGTTGVLGIFSTWTQQVNKQVGSVRFDGSEGMEAVVNERELFEVTVLVGDAAVFIKSGLQEFSFVAGYNFKSQLVELGAERAFELLGLLCAGGEDGDMSVGLPLQAGNEGDGVVEEIRPVVPVVFLESFEFC